MTAGGSANPPDITYVKKGEEQPYKFEIKATVINPAKITAVKAAKDELNVKLNEDKTLAEVCMSLIYAELLENLYWPLFCTVSHIDTLIF